MQDQLFKGLYRELWRKMVPPALTVAEVDFILQNAKLTKSSRVLDMMCGFGRHATLLAPKVGHVKAIDSQKNYIDEINEYKISNLSAIVENVRNLATSDLYDCIICMGNSIASLDKLSQQKLLTFCADSLVPDGVLIINNWMITEIIATKFREKEWFKIENFTYLIANEYQLNPTRLESVHVLIEEGVTKETINDVDYILSIEEYLDLFKMSGFHGVDIYSTPRNRPYRLGDDHLYFVVSKTKN